MRTFHGGCHCGAVRFEVQADPGQRISACNCSICLKCGYLHLIVPTARFRLLSGADVLTSYRFNTGVANHLFCNVCGVKCHYTPRSHPNDVSVNLRCLDDVDLDAWHIEPFDGRNWEASVASIQ